MKYWASLGMHPFNDHLKGFWKEGRIDDAGFAMERMLLVLGVLREASAGCWQLMANFKRTRLRHLRQSGQTARRPVRAHHSQTP